MRFTFALARSVRDVPMRPLTQVLPLQFRRAPHSALGFIVFGLIAAYELAGFIINNDISSLAYVGIACVVGAFVVAMLNNWRNGLYFFLTLASV
jgi:inner membrane protein involved in colicin E2 resistance